MWYFFNWENIYDRAIHRILTCFLFLNHFTSITFFFSVILVVNTKNIQMFLKTSVCLKSWWCNKYSHDNSCISWNKLKILLCPSFIFDVFSSAACLWRICPASVEVTLRITQMYHITATQTEDSGKGPFSKTPVSAGNRALFVSLCFHLQRPQLARPRYCTPALWAIPPAQWLSLWQNMCKVNPSSTHIYSVWPRGARRAWWAGQTLWSRWTPLKNKQSHFCQRMTNSNLIKNI